MTDIGMKTITKEIAVIVMIEIVAIIMMEIMSAIMVIKDKISTDRSARLLCITTGTWRSYGFDSFWRLL